MTNAGLLKQEGNKAFADKNYVKAAVIYRDAIKEDTFNPILYSNRAQCFLKTHQYERALKDTITGINLKPEKKSLIKLYYRKGLALVGLGKKKFAIESFEAALKLDPKNDAVQKELDQLKAELQPPKPSIKHTTDKNKPIDIPIEECDKLPEEFAQLLKDKDPQPQSPTPIVKPVSDRANKEIEELFGNKKSKTDTKYTIQPTPESIDSNSPMRFLTSLASLPDAEKSKGYQYVINISLDDYKTVFESNAVDPEFLQFYLDAASYVAINDSVPNWDSQIVTHLQYFSKLPRFKVNYLLCNPESIQSIINLVKEKSTNEYHDELQSIFSK
ncbi:hypothetical protein DFJ63DRAFT_315579 [Scheffersomyces coipomensis]|uniref:uncharacterized protein n=1 Tax=Scheffersomyces coipomensis TaxID=1788519 RepID=UPI00315D6B00